MKTERAEAGTRIHVTAEDRKYTGLARHPLARRWMLNQLAEARENAAAAKSKDGKRRWSAEVGRMSGELRRCGVGSGDQ